MKLIYIESNSAFQVPLCAATVSDSTRTTGYVVSETTDSYLNFAEIYHYRNVSHRSFSGEGTTALNPVIALGDDSVATMLFVNNYGDDRYLIRCKLTNQPTKKTLISLLI